MNEPLKASPSTDVSFDLRASGATALAILRALGKIEPPHPHQAIGLVMIVGPVTEQQTR